MTNREFVDELSSDSPAPGGGSVAALCAAQAAGLVAMVGNLTVDKRTYADVQDRVKEIAEQAQDLKDFFLAAIDADTAAFNAVMDCFRLPRGKQKDLAVAEATREATRVPLSVLEKVPPVLELAGEIGRIGNRNSLSDAGVAALAGMAGAEGAYYNVLINLDGLRDLDQSAAPSFIADTRRAAADALARCEELADGVKQTIRGGLEAALDG
jgi:glutamate formiminotransferase/formiminotetrahydrofolate cyclodeaminase